MTVYLSNCAIESLRHYLAHRRAGRRVVITWRRTDVGDVPHSHMGWALYDQERKVYVPYGFKPVAPRRVPWYLIWTRLVFRGAVVQGDDPPAAS